MAKTKANKTAKKKSAEPEKIKLHLIQKQGTQVWEAELAGKQVTTRSGSLHSMMKAKTFKLGTPEKARAKYDELVAAQRKLRYRTLGEIDAPAVPIARDEALEAAIREDRDDPAPYLVYADWLQSQGSPVGEMLVLASRNKRKEAAAIAKKIGLPDEQVAQVGWRHGLWEWLYINNDVDPSDSSWDPVPTARALFGSPLAAALEHLRIGMMRWDYQDDPDVIREAGKHGWAKDLLRLTVGEVDRNIDMAHHAIGEVGRATTQAFPKLVELKLRSGQQSWRGRKETFGFGGLDLPDLKELVIETCAMTRPRMKMLTGAKLPKLEKLEVWFGDKMHESITPIAECTPIWEGKLFPKLEHLGLCNSELTTDFVRLVPPSKIAGQLVTLDLSRGVLDDNDAKELLAEAKRFPKLKRLNLDRSYVSAALLKQLKAAFKGVEVTAQNQKERDPDDPDWRYVSVGE
jgi:uncharacterized protein (TIGR02996 family)